jgi:8-oxo-dGTP pyrophosphatase MutT (NUDIX family)
VTIWIDPPRWPAHQRLWSHLISDQSYDELHTFAGAVGIPRGAFEGDHYDVPQERYDALVSAGAAPTSGKDVARRLRDSGLRFPKRRGEKPLASVRDIVPGLSVGHRMDLIASPLPTPEGQTAAAAVFVVDAAGSLLLVHSVVRDAWGAPAGGREPGEQVREGAVREVWEESGLRLLPDDLVPCGYERLIFDDGVPVGRWPHVRNYVACFVRRRDVGRPRVVPVLDDVDAADWFGYDEVERRCRNEYWWPLLERVVAAVARA